MRMRIGPVSRQLLGVRRLLAPAVVALALTVTVVTAFMFWAAAGVDERSLARQTAMVAHSFAEQFASIPHDQQGVTIWDDAVVRTKMDPDPEWIDANLGSWMYNFFGHDRVFILDAHNAPIYAMARGDVMPVSLYGEDRATIDAMVQRLRARIADGALERYYGDDTDEPFPGIIDIANISGSAAIVSIEPIVSDTGRIVQTPGTEFLHVSIVFLDANFAARLAQQYLFQQARFSATPTPAAGIANYAIMTADGRIASFFEWAPSSPGQELLGQTGPAVGFAFLVAVVLVLLLADRLRRSSRALEAGRRNAQHLANHDALTGLPNRTLFDERLAAAIGSYRAADEQLALMLLDLDRFKQVNDTFGHEAGDELIRAVGQRLGELLGPRDVLSRMGGDEFGLIHTARGDVREALQLGQRIIDAVGKPFDVQGREAFVGVSIGVVLAGASATHQELTRRADIALHEAKAGGRNRAVLYREEMNETVQNRHTIESELREALKRGTQLSVAFQPLIARETGRITGAEALARWTNPRLGLVSPAHFIPVAEATGLIQGLGEVVLRSACQLGARWPGMTIAVNISPAQLKAPNFVQKLFRLLEETGMRPTDLELEITEGILIEDDQATTGVLHTCRSAGIRIALDDFGTGYSSLNYLKRYPVDCIKIDRSFVSQLAPGSVSVAIVQAMVTLAHALNIEVTSEGVETHEQMQMLSQMGCNTFQGFLLSPPVAPTVMENLFRGLQPSRPIAAVA